MTIFLETGKKDRCSFMCISDEEFLYSIVQCAESGHTVIVSLNPAVAFIFGIDQLWNISSSD